MSLLDRIFPWLGHARCLATPPSLDDQEVAALRLDAAGRLVVTSESDAVIPYSQASATASTLIVRASPGILGALYAASLEASTLLYVQLHNSVIVPAGGAVPQHVFPLVAGGLVSVEALGGLAFATGITAVVSSTPGTYTAVAGSPAHLIGKHRGP